MKLFYLSTYLSIKADPRPQHTHRLTLIEKYTVHVINLELLLFYGFLFIYFFIFL